MNLIKSTIRNISIQKEETEKRAKEIMAHFGEADSELKSITRCSNILKFEAQLEDDFLKGNDITLTFEIYIIMKEYSDPLKNFSCRYEYHVHWIRNEMSSDGTYPQDDDVQFSGYSRYERVVDSIQTANNKFEDFKERKVEKLIIFFGIKLC